jgi:hypothetical protein
VRELVSVVIGGLIASVVPAAVLALIWPLSGRPTFDSYFATFVVLLPFSVATVVVLGLPAFLLLRPLRPSNWWSVSVIGFLLGLVTAVISRLPSHPGIFESLVMASLGALSAFIFWIVWNYGRKPRS